MNTNEQVHYLKGALLSIDEAIKISKMLCTAPEERIPMILDVFSKARVNINGLDKLEEWKALSDQGYIIDMDEFHAELIKGREDEPLVDLDKKAFERICQQFNVKPSCAKRALYRKQLIKTQESPAGKINFTFPAWVDNHTERRIVILNTKPIQEDQNG